MGFAAGAAAGAAAVDAGEKARLRRRELELQNQEKKQTKLDDDTNKVLKELTDVAIEIQKASPENEDFVIGELRAELGNTARFRAIARPGATAQTIQREIERAQALFDTTVAATLSAEDASRSEGRASVAGLQAQAEALSQAGRPTTVEETAEAAGVLNEPDFQTDVGKLFADRQLAVEQFGEGSPQVRIVDGALDDEQNPAPSISDSTSLFKEFSRQSKDFVAAAGGLQKVINAAKEDSGPGDIALIFGFFKSIDPASTVREGEFATAEQVKGVDDQLLGLYNRVIDGERLTPEQRQKFIRATASQFLALAEQQQSRRQTFQNLATGLGLDAGLIVQDAVPPGFVNEARRLVAKAERFFAISAPVLTDRDQTILKKTLEEISIEEVELLSPAGAAELSRRIDEVKKVQ